MRRRPMPRPKFTLTLGASSAGALLGLVVSLTELGAATRPGHSYTIDGIEGTNGWYRGSSHGNNVVVHWTVTSTRPRRARAAAADHGPRTDAGLHEDMHACAERRGARSTVTTKSIKIDADPPTGVAAQLSRGPDYNGWYNHPVSDRAGRDRRDLRASRPAPSDLRRPRSAPEPHRHGQLHRQRGQHASASVALNYDATAPVLSKVRVDSKARSDLVHWARRARRTRVVVQRWARGKGAQQACSSDGSGGGFTDSKIAPGLEYIYAVQTFDQAGNASKRIARSPGCRRCFSLRQDRVRAAGGAKPILRWNRVRGAQYYNVQLYRGSKRIFAAWPAKNQLGLPPAGAGTASATGSRPASTAGTSGPASARARSRTTRRSAARSSSCRRASYGGRGSL